MLHSLNELEFFLLELGKFQAYFKIGYHGSETSKNHIISRIISNIYSIPNRSKVRISP